jgi:hypothetical protein
VVGLESLRNVLTFLFLFFVDIASPEGSFNIGWFPWDGILKLTLRNVLTLLFLIFFVGTVFSESSFDIGWFLWEWNLSLTLRNILLTF